MEIVMAEESHIPGMIALLRQVGQVHHNIRPDIFRSDAQKYREQDLQGILAAEDSPIFIGLSDGAVVGYCFCQWRRYRGSGVLTDRVELYIDDLCVDEGHRGRGAATALYRHVCAWAKDRGCEFITLNVWTGNDGAQAFYEKMGMTPRNVTMEQKL